MSDWQTIQQFLRIILYSVGGYLLGDGVANSAQYQAAVGGVINLIAFAWWLYQQKKLKGALPVLAFIVVAPLLLGGCSEYVQRGLDFLSSGLSAVKAEVQSACAQVGAAEIAAETAVVVVGAGCSKWHARVVRARKGIAAICTNLDKLDDAVIGNYVTSVRTQLQGVKSAKPDGC